MSIRAALTVPGGDRAMPAAVGNGAAVNRAVTVDAKPVIPDLAPADRQQPDATLRRGLQAPADRLVFDANNPRRQPIAADRETTQALEALNVHVAADGDLRVGISSVPFGTDRLTDIQAKATNDGLTVAATDSDGTALTATIDPLSSTALITRNGVERREAVSFEAGAVLDQIVAGTGPLSRGADQQGFVPSQRPALTEMYGPVRASVNLDTPVTVNRTPIDTQRPAVTDLEGRIIVNDALIARYGERYGATDVPRYQDAARNNEMTHALWTRMFDQAWERSGRSPTDPARERALTTAFDGGRWFAGMDVGVPGYDTSRVTTGQVNELASDAASIATYPRPEIDRIMRSATQVQGDDGYNLSQRLIMESYVRARIAREPGLDPAQLRQQVASAADSDRLVSETLGLTDADIAFIQRDYMQVAQRGIQRYDAELRRRYGARQ